MICIQGQARPQFLGFPSSFLVMLPDAASLGRAFPAVLCLHDVGRDSSWFHLNARMEAMVEKHRLALILPDGRNSCFADMEQGPSWGKALAEGLMPLVRNTFPMKDGEAGILGVGTGGWAAARLSAQRPRLFTACATVDMTPYLAEQYACGELTGPGEWAAIFGEPEKMSVQDASLIHWINPNAPACCLIGDAPDVRRFYDDLSRKGAKPHRAALDTDADFEEKMEAALSYLSIQLWGGESTSNDE